MKTYYDHFFSFLDDVKQVYFPSTPSRHPKGASPHPSSRYSLSPPRTNFSIKLKPFRGGGHRAHDASPSPIRPGTSSKASVYSTTSSMKSHDQPSPRPLNDSTSTSTNEVMNPSRYNRVFRYFTLCYGILRRMERRMTRFLQSPRSTQQHRSHRHRTHTQEPIEVRRGKVMLLEDELETLKREIDQMCTHGSMEEETTSVVLVNEASKGRRYMKKNARRPVRAANTIATDGNSSKEACPYPNGTTERMLPVMNLRGVTDYTLPLHLQVELLQYKAQYASLMLYLYRRSRTVPLKETKW